ncbi:SWI/SNF related, matrix associated, actin-like protein dependent regulator of chromatin, subfamily d, member 1 [Pilaira anomala]|nr:SWI/SNF related, matrix associated, actin-like protein dependent regulator of chromatin, subfamily d, member 1 [Pilaira anomala]
MQPQPHVFQQHTGGMPQQPMVPLQQGMAPPAMQYRKRPSEVDTLSKHIKKKRPTDKNMPPKIESFVPESKLYTDLVEFEKKLDATIMRKRLDIQEALGKPNKIRRTLRLFISNTVVDQSSSTEDVNNFDLHNGNVSSWALRIEGKLLNVSNEKTQPNQKLTSFFRSAIIELDRDPNLYPEGNIIEWQKQPNTPDFDMIEIKRKGDMNVKCKIILNLDSNPQKFKLSPALADLLDVKMETKPHIVMGIWNYCKNHKLQDVEDKRLIRCDNRLAQIFGYPQLHFAQLPELITPHLSRPDPVIIDYTIRVDKPLSQSSKCYDIDVELDSPVRQKMMNIVSSTQTQKEIMGLDDKIVQCVQSINNSKIKRDFLIQFSKEPVEFINKWIASQARDLEVILGESKVNLEEVRQSEFYKQPWMKEAVFHYLTTKTQQRMQELLTTQRG